MKNPPSCQDGIALEGVELEDENVFDSGVGGGRDAGFSTLLMAVDDGEAWGEMILKGLVVGSSPPPLYLFNLISNRSIPKV